MSNVECDRSWVLLFLFHADLFDPSLISTLTSAGYTNNRVLVSTGMPNQNNTLSNKQATTATNRQKINVDVQTELYGWLLC